MSGSRYEVGKLPWLAPIESTLLERQRVASELTDLADLQFCMVLHYLSVACFVLTTFKHNTAT